MPNAYISGTGMFVPPKVVTNQMLADEYGIETSHEWIHSRTGIEERRYAEDGVGSSDLAVGACNQAIEAAGLTPKDIGLIIFATLSPDHHFPGAGVYLQRKMGFLEADNFVPALDIRNQCSGFVYGLSVAASMVQAGGVDNVLLVGAETHSHALDFSTRGRAVTSLFGDGAGAVVVSATDEDRGVRGWTLGADGRHADVLAQKVWDIGRMPFLPLDDQGRGIVETDMLWANMKGKTVFKHAVRRMIEALMQSCLKLGVTRDDIDLFCFHQANLRINEHVQKMLEIPSDKIVHNIEKYGNTTAATIPLLLAEAVRSGKLKRGMKVAMVAFGSGFTWGSVIVDW
jgi:3-oxoacyl-[acyl-carrier-protein] synthase III